MEPHLVMVMLSTMMVTHSQWPWIKRWNSWVGFQELCFAPTPTLSFIIWISSDSLLNLNPLQPFSMLHSTWMSTRQIKTKRLDCALDSHTSSRLDITEVSHCHTQIWRTRHHLASSKHKGNNKGKPNFQNYKNLVCPPNIRDLMTNYDVFRSRRKIKIIKSAMLINKIPSISNKSKLYWCDIMIYQTNDHNKKLGQCKS